MAKLKNRKLSNKNVCQACVSLLEFNDLFDSFYHSGDVLKKRKATYNKASGSTYYNVVKQNRFLSQSVFDSNGNYPFHQDCIRATFRISNQCFVQLRKSIQQQKSQPMEFTYMQERLSYPLPC